MLGSRNFHKLIVKENPPVSDGADGAADGKVAPGTKSMRRPDGIDREVRKSCENGLVTAVYVLSAPYSWRRLSIFVECSNFVERWHTTPSRALRSVDETAEWMYSQVTEQLMVHLSSMFAAINYPSIVKRMGFWVGHVDAPQPDESVVAMEDLLAQEAAALCMSMIRQRMVRTLHMSVGWPNGFVRLLSKDATVVQAELSRFQVAYLDSQRFQEYLNEDDKARDLVNKSLFKRTPVRQLVVAFEESGWRMTPQITKHLESVFRRNEATIVVADGFNHVKNDRVTLKARNLSRPEKSMATLVGKKILSTRHRCHRYNEIEAETICPRATSMPRETFEVPKNKCSLPMKDLIGNSSATRWWSPGIQRLMCPVADIQLMRYACECGDVGVVSTSWLGALASVDHNLMLRQISWSSQWFFSFGAVGDNCVLRWPAYEREATDPDNSKNIVYFEPDVLVRELVLRPICDLQSWTACTVEYRSPAWAASRHMNMKLSRRLLALRASEPASLLQTAARHSFWSLSHPVLQALGKHLGCTSMGSSTSLFDTLSSLLTFVLPEATEQDIVQLCSLRCVNMSSKSSRESFQDLLELDAATWFLDKDDITALQKESSKAAETSGRVDEFRAALHQKRASLASSRSGSSGSGGVGQAAPRLRVPQKGFIAHGEIKALSPPGSFVWRAQVSGAWCGKLPPHREHARSWSKYGEREAALLIVKLLWQEWCDANAIPVSQCPVGGLFDAGGDGHPVSNEPAPSAASSSGAPRGRNAGASQAQAVVAPDAAPAAKGAAKA